MQHLIKTEEAKKADIVEIFDMLGTNDKGLTSTEAGKRLEIYGPNEIIEVKKSALKRFLENFWGPIPWMIEIAAVLSILIEHWDDFIIIIAMLLVNAVVRFWEENKADNAVELLKEKLALKARTMRDNKWIELPARELVPGDLIRVRLGDIIPADIKLFEGDFLTLDESVLTGESLPVDKKSSDIAFEGAIVRKGEMNGIVVGTGLNTFFGKTTSLVSGAKKRSHFQMAVVKIGNYLIILAVALVTIVFVVELVRLENFFEILQFALVLIIAAIPVALPAVLMVSMAVGAADLAKKKAIAKRLLAIEELAGMDVLCSDKTGTITKNEISIGEIVPFDTFTAEDVILYGVLSSREEDKDPIDDSFFTKLKEMNRDSSNYVVKKFNPFDPVVKRTEAILEENGKTIKVSKGAVQVILNLISNKSNDLESQVKKQSETFASQGYRALGIARTDQDGVWQYVGLVALFDPPREDSAETIKNAVSMGIDVKMVTGDHVAIARQISSELGMGDNFVSASQLMEKNEATEKLAEGANGFAEVYPEHKYNIVEYLQDRGHIVGMTGDGVNDAPALKIADVGIAVSNATDAAKSAADIVLTDPGLSVIIGATIESRIIFERMKSYATYRIAETVRVLIFLVMAILIFNFYPITAIMIVLLALLNDLPIMTIAFDNARPSDVPVRWKMQRVLIVASTLGIIGVFFSFMLFLIGKDVFNLSLPTLQTFIFLKLAVGGHMTIYLTRSEDHHFWKKPYPAKILFIACESTQVVATIFAALGVLMTPIGWALAGFVWLYAFGAFAVANFIKVALVRYLRRNKN
ncbi:MAG: plasma-membrane proton-efflux P-type ATPase [Candidatus Lokiarchaeota archaeon]|nr:plasma-membrane proton-efflux P-type ATPase [Candidatus Lokiarchaeota archaeon]